MLERAYTALRDRLTKYSDAEEAKRIAEASRLRAEAEEKERLAREAEAAERQAIVDAEEGECTDVGEAIEVADQTFADFRRADKTAAIAAKNVPVRFASVLGGKSVTMRTTEVLTVTDAFAALKAMGVTPEIEEVLLSAARKYRKEFDELPSGITATFKRSL
jgi:hypothetical protein